MLETPCYSPSLQERRKVRVESISFLILIRASRTIGPQLYKEERQSTISRPESVKGVISVVLFVLEILSGFMVKENF